MCRNYFLVPAACLLIAWVAAGCIVVGGSDRYESKYPTTGKQLQDLKIAHDNGAISDQEYEKTKAKLLNDGH